MTNKIRMQLQPRDSLWLLISRLLLGGGQYLVLAFCFLVVWEEFTLYMHSYDMEIVEGGRWLFGIGLLLFGLLITTGFWFRMASLFLALCTLLFMFGGMAFWKMPPHSEFIVRLLYEHFLIVVGGLLFYAGLGPGRYALTTPEPLYLNTSLFKNWAFFGGRMIIGGTLLWIVVNLFQDWGPWVLLVRGLGVPFPHIALWVIVIVKGVGGVLILTGYHHRIASIALMLLFGLTAIVWHPPFDAALFVATPLPDRMAMTTFLIEVVPHDSFLAVRLFSHLVGSIGALLALYVAPPGRYSVLGRAGLQ